MKIQQRITRILGVLLIAGLCVTPEMVQAAAQQNTQATVPQTTTTRAQDNRLQDNNQGSGQNPQASPQPGDQGGQSQPQTKPPGSGTTVDPSQAPLQPVTTYPDAPTPQQDQQPNDAQPVQGTKSQQSGQDQSKQDQQPKKPVTEPAGAAAAEKVPTTGGAASRPAGVAIAPAKQHQTRSLLIKLGAIAAAGVAAGTVYGLSRSTSSTPPNASAAGTIRK
jgi:hypothetical protein